MAYVASRFYVFRGLWFVVVQIVLRRDSVNVIMIIVYKYGDTMVLI